MLICKTFAFSPQMNARRCVRCLSLSLTISKICDLFFPREPIPPPSIQNKPNGHPSSSMTRSSSLRRVRNKDLLNNKDTNTLNYPLSRSGTSNTLDRNHERGGGGVKRTPSMTTVRRFRDRDLNVKLSRGIQTQLTKDTVDELDFNDDGSIPTK